MGLFALTICVFVCLLLLAALIAGAFIAFESPYGFTRYSHEGARLLDAELRPERELLAPSAGKLPFVLRESVAARMVDLFGRCADMLRQRAVVWWAVGATLLGARRHRGLVPFSDCMQIAMRREDLGKLVCGGELPLGLAFGRTSQGYSIWSADSLLRYPCVDVSVVELRSGELALGTPLDELGNCTFEDSRARPHDVLPSELVFPLALLPFMGTAIPVPAKSEECLDIMCGGTSWRCSTMEQGAQHVSNRLTRSLREMIGLSA